MAVLVQCGRGLGVPQGPADRQDVAAGLAGRSMSLHRLPYSATNSSLLLGPATLAEKEAFFKDQVANFEVGPGQGPHADSSHTRHKVGGGQRVREGIVSRYRGRFRRPAARTCHSRAYVKVGSFLWASRFTASGVGRPRSSSRATLSCAARILRRIWRANSLRASGSVRSFP
jgi:hypothetical protein